ncbi:MAG: hypothetical protein ACRDQA_30990 [Nocardioidaceae bacterium]
MPAVDNASLDDRLAHANRAIDRCLERRDWAALSIATDARQEILDELTERLHDELARLT